MVLALADQIVAAPKFAGQSLDINIVRACSICSAPTRASTSACASISTAAS
jgi:hypothetical protein